MSQTDLETQARRGGGYSLYLDDKDDRHIF